MLLVAEIAISNEVAFAVVGGLVSAIGALFWLVIARYDALIKELQSRGDSYKEMAEEAIANLEKAVNNARRKRGDKDFEVVAPIVPEHSSPTTKHQQSTADIGTMRARLVEATKVLDLPAREAAPPE